MFVISKKKKFKNVWKIYGIHFNPRKVHSQTLKKGNGKRCEERANNYTKEEEGGGGDVGEHILQDF
jgi:hypothetical protein